VVVGSCDFDPDFEKFRAGPFTFSSAAGIQKYKGRTKQGDVINSEMLDNPVHFQWVLQRRLARLKFGTTLLKVPVRLDPWANLDVGKGIFFTSEDGPGPDGYVLRAFKILRRAVDLPNRIVTWTLWDVGDIFIATAYESEPGAADGLARVFYATDDSSVEPNATDDADLEPLAV
jgi:hypothetical protein